MVFWLRDETILPNYQSSFKWKLSRVVYKSQERTVANHGYIEDRLLSIPVCQAGWDEVLRDSWFPNKKPYGCMIKLLVKRIL